MAIAARNFRSSPRWVPPAIALAWVATLVAATKFGTIAYAFPLLAVAATVAGFTFLRATQGHPYAIGTILVLVLLLIDVKLSEREPFVTDFQVAMKVATFAALIALACLRWRSIARIILKPEIVLLFAYAAIAFLSALWSEVPFFSGGAGIGLFAYGALACIVVVDLHEETVIRLFVWTLLAFICAGIIGTAVAPNITWLAGSLDEFEFGTRLQGFAGHPNILGQFAAILILMVLTARRQGLLSRPTCYLILALSIATILATGSRTALIALLSAWGLVAIRNSRIAGAVAMTLVGAAVFALVLAALGLFPDVSGLFGKLSRTGRESEILTLTGRTDLWDISWTKIIQKPFFGWGYFGTEQIIADSVDPTGNSAVKHAHNMFLQSLLSVGILGSLPGFAYVLLLLSRFVTHPDPTRDQITLLFLVLGFSEPGIFGMPVVASFFFDWVLARDAAKMLRTKGLDFKLATAETAESSVSLAN